MSVAHVENVNGSEDFRWIPVDFMPLNSRILFIQIEDAVFAVSMMVNVLFAAVLLTEKNEVLRSYTMVLMQNCICDMLYTITSFFVKLHSEFYDGRIAQVVSGVYFKNASRKWHYFGLASYVFTLYLAMFVIPVVFYFRYTLIIRKIHLSASQLRRIMLGLAFCALIPTVFLMLSCLNNDGPGREELCQKIMSHPIWTYGGLTVTDCLLAPATDIFLILYCVTAGIGNVIMYVVMIYCTRKVYGEMTKFKQNLWQKTSKLQAQMNALLLVQLITPTVCVEIPLTAAVISCIFHITFPGLGLLVEFGFMWIPLINPIITILLVSNYRRKFQKIICFPTNTVYTKIFKQKNHFNQTSSFTYGSTLT